MSYCDDAVGGSGYWSWHLTNDSGQPVAKELLRDAFYYQDSSVEHLTKEPRVSGASHYYEPAVSQLMEFVGDAYRSATGKGACEFHRLYFTQKLGLIKDHLHEYDGYRADMRRLPSPWLADLKAVWGSLPTPTVLLEKIQYFGSEVLKGFADRDKLADKLDELYENSNFW